MCSACTTVPPPPPDPADVPRTVDEAITSRRSVRAFLPTPVPRAILDAFEAESPEHTRTWQYYPEELFDPISAGSGRSVRDSTASSRSARATACG